MEKVDHPQHYQNGGMETLEMMQRIWGLAAVIQFCYMNAFKYRQRAGYKDDAGEDIKKALWYEAKAEELKNA